MEIKKKKKKGYLTTIKSFYISDNSIPLIYGHLSASQTGGSPSERHLQGQHVVLCASSDEQHDTAIAS